MQARRNETLGLIGDRERLYSDPRAPGPRAIRIRPAKQTRKQELAEKRNPSGDRERLYISLHLPRSLLTSSAPQALVLSPRWGGENGGAPVVEEDREEAGQAVQEAPERPQDLCQDKLASAQRY
ncbi:hypothetical protein NL676_008751 [Syzygium grande]|nr:hypothetical protein NL676_008751 [Syzygium grande]